VTYLLDVNVLIALVDPAHVSHDAAHEWFAREGRTSWATCPLTENGLIRIVGHPRYPNSLGSPAAAMELLKRLTALTGHVFWGDAISLRDASGLDASKILAPAQVTDVYLLALATANAGILATLDRRLPTIAVSGGREHLRVIA
jgi:toxin-antitoxin system PIN domain toxin